MILVIEDNADDSFLLTRQIARAGLGERVQVIGDGKDALDFLLLTEDVPEIVFLDLRLPRVSGLQLLERIRQEERLTFLPVIVMTSSIDPTDVESCTALGVTAYLPKPVGLETFQKIIGHLSSK